MKMLTGKEETEVCLGRIEEGWATLQNMKDMTKEEQFVHFEEAIKALQTIYHIAEDKESPNYKTIYNIVDEFMDSVEQAQDSCENQKYDKDSQGLCYEGLDWKALCDSLEPEIASMQQSVPKIMAFTPMSVCMFIMILFIAVVIGVRVFGK